MQTTNQNSDIFNLFTSSYISELHTLDNPFIRQLVTLAVQQAQNLKFSTFVTQDPSSNRGEISTRGIKPQDKSVLDLNKLTPLQNQHARNLQEELAYYMQSILHLPPYTIYPNFYLDNKEFLTMEYLLTVCLCYVEVFDNSNTVEKFLATRNMNILRHIADIEPAKQAKFQEHLVHSQFNYTYKKMQVLKVRPTKKGFSITQPRSAIDFTKMVRVTPIFLLSAFHEGISKALETNILRFTYIKDNLTEREMYTTINPAILLNYYPQDQVQLMVNKMESNQVRGYIKLPEIGLSQYDDSGVRALNISRITSVELVNPNDPRLQDVTKYIKVNFENILPSFKTDINKQRNPQVLLHIYQELTGQTPSEQTMNNVAEMQRDITDFVDNQYIIGTTTALRHIHDYMESRPKFFPTYNDPSSIPDLGFNLRAPFGGGSSFGMADE